MSNWRRVRSTPGPSSNRRLFWGLLFQKSGLANWKLFRFIRNRNRISKGNEVGGGICFPGLIVSSLVSRISSMFKAVIF